MSHDPQILGWGVVGVAGVRGEGLLAGRQILLGIMIYVITHSQYVGTW